MNKIVCYDAAGNIIRQLYQWDRDIILVMTGVDQSIVDSDIAVHFSNKTSKTAYVIPPTVDGTTVSASIPNALLQNAETISVYLYTNDGNGEGRTRRVEQIRVSPRPMPDDYDLPIDDGLIHIRQGEARPIGFVVTDDRGTIIVDTDITSINATVCDVTVGVQYDAQEECFVWNATQEQTLSMPSGKAPVQIKVKFTDDTVSIWESYDVLIIESSRCKEEI